MSISIHDVSVPIFVNSLRAMSSWLDKAAAEKPESDLLLGRLAPDMRPLPAQYQMASDSAKNAVARLAGIQAPAMPDNETTFAELKERCAKTITFVEGVDPAALASGAEREVELKFPNGTGYRFTGQAYLTGFALPNFFFPRHHRLRDTTRGRREPWQAGLPATSRAAEHPSSEVDRPAPAGLSRYRLRSGG